MSDEQVAAWLRLADNDLHLAQIALAEEIYPQACFLCQQAVEKALKAYLLARQQPLIRSHVLPRLQYLAEQLDASFEQLDDVCSVLTEYYIDTRYPDAATDLAAYDELVATEAVQLADQALTFIYERIQR